MRPTGQIDDPKWQDITERDELIEMYDIAFRRLFSRVEHAIHGIETEQDPDKSETHLELQRAQIEAKSFIQALDSETEIIQ